MILSKDLVTKVTKKGRGEAASLLLKLAQLGGLPPPTYEYEVSGTPKKLCHYCHVRFRVPKILETAHITGTTSSWIIEGSGKCVNKKNAKTYAAHEVVLQLEESMGLSRGGIPQYLKNWRQRRDKSQEELQSVPIAEAIPNVTWNSFPVDPQFAEAGRRGRIDFVSELIEDKVAFETAKTLTLLYPSGLPQVTFHHNHTDTTGQIQKFANLKPVGGGGGFGSIGRVNMGVQTSSPTKHG